MCSRVSSGQKIEVKPGHVPPWWQWVLSRGAEPTEGHLLPGREAEPFVEGDRGGVGFGDVQEGAFAPRGDPGDECADQAGGVPAPTCLWGRAHGADLGPA